MAASSRRNPPAEPNYFFKIILSDVVSDSKMMIPKKFVRKYGKNLGDHVLLKAPYGASWQVELERSEGEVWLHKGWHEFAKHYSIRFGHALVFRYEGDSLFHVIIFDKSASEVEYPRSDTHIEQANLSGSYQQGNKVNEMEDHTISCEKSKPRACAQTEKSLVTYSRSYKKTRANSAREEAKPGGGCCARKTHESQDDSSSTKRMKTKHSEEPNNITNPKEHLSQFKAMGTQPDRMKPIELEEKQEVKGKRVNRWKFISKAAKARAFESAKAYKSDNPFSIVIMQPSYISRHSVHLSNAFTGIYVRKHVDIVVLQSEDGGTWPVKCCLGVSTSRLTSGWSAFVRHHHLVKGDVCVFELIDRTKKLLKVVIFRARNNTSS